jgi:hypothetical protein
MVTSVVDREGDMLHWWLEDWNFLQKQTIDPSRVVSISIKDAYKVCAVERCGLAAYKERWNNPHFVWLTICTMRVESGSEVLLVALCDSSWRE